MTGSQSTYELGPHRQSGSGRKLSNEVELARPQTAGEEELQLQLALALSKEEHDKDSKKKQSDDLRLEMAIEQSQAEVSIHFIIIIVVLFHNTYFGNKIWALCRGWKGKGV